MPVLPDDEYVYGVADRTAAEGLRGSFLRIRNEEIKDLPEGRDYHHDLMGLTVISEDGRRLGSVAGIIPTGGNLVFEVRDGNKEVLIPYIDDVVREVDLEGGTLTVRLIAGLLPGE